MSVSPRWVQRYPCFLLEMPHEILYTICEEIVGTDGGIKDIKSLARLARTCKAMSMIVTPLLYHHIIDPAPPSDRRDDTSERLYALSLLVSLHMNPALGLHIRTMEFANPRLYHEHNDVFASLQYSAAIDYASDDSPTWPGDLKHPSGPYYLATPVLEVTLLKLAPNLHTLSLSISPAEWRHTNFLLFKGPNRRVVGPIFTHRSLTTLNVRFLPPLHNQRHASGLNIHKLNGLLQCLPNLLTLSIDKPRGGTSMTARLTNLTSLKLTLSYLTPRALKNLLRHCRNLAHFHIQHDHVERWSRAYLPVSPQEVVEYLAPAAASLRKLHIDPYVPKGRSWEKAVTVNHGGDGEGMGGYRLMKGLGRFGQLRQVGVHYGAIARPAVLGWHGAVVELLKGCRKIEGVLFFGVERLVVGELKGFARAVARSQWPELRKVKLRSVEWETQMDMKHSWEDLERKLAGMEREVREMRENGVEVVGVEGLSDDFAPFADA